MTTPNGLLVLDKPAGITSRDAVNRAAGWFPRRTKLGHTGTLDPLATGVLVLCVGQATRLAEFVQEMSKSYRTDAVFGVRSDTDDADGTLTPVPGAAMPALSEVESALGRFIGTIEQVPPAFSAIKVAGRRAHDLARGGEAVELTARPVRIDRIDIVAYDPPRLTLEVYCGKGTYIRSLVRDLGDALGCGAHVATLRRLWVGPFRAEDGVSLEDDATAVRAKLLPLVSAVDELPRLRVTDAEAARLRTGQAVEAGAAELAAAHRRDGVRPDAGRVAVLVGPELVAVAEVGPGRVLRPVKVIGA